MTEDDDVDDGVSSSPIMGWIRRNWPYIGMLLLALAGVTIHAGVTYWIVLVPIFAVICVIAGWHRCETRQARMELIVTQALSWLAVVVAFYVLTSSGVQGLMNVPATSLAKLTQLSLGTFVAGLQARVWRICAVGAMLMLAVPALGSIKQSGLLIAGAAVLILGFVAVTWWLDRQRPRSGAAV